MRSYVVAFKDCVKVSGSDDNQLWRPGQKASNVEQPDVVMTKRDREVTAGNEASWRAKRALRLGTATSDGDHPTTLGKCRAVHSFPMSLPFDRYRQSECRY